MSNWLPNAGTSRSHAPAWECCLGRSSGPRGRRSAGDRRPRWSVGARLNAGWRWVALVGALWFAPLAVLAAPAVVASIKPVHALVAGVMLGVGEPRLLVAGGASPHEYSLKPSDGRAPNPATVGAEQAQHHAHQGGFAGAVRADQGDDFARSDLEIHVAQDRLAPDGEMDVFDRQ